MSVCIGKRTGGVKLPESGDHCEAPGQGVQGTVNGHDVRVGARAFVLPDCDDGVLLATTEQMLLHVDTKAGRAAPAPPEILARVQRFVDASAALPRPERAGRKIGLPAGAPT